MKKIVLISKKYFYIILQILLLPIVASSCVKDLLDQQPTTELGADAFWKTDDDALSALMGAYSHIRNTFNRDYFLEGHGEYTKVRGKGESVSSGNFTRGDAYEGGNTTPQGYGSSWDKMYRYLYGGVNRTNYVIENVKKMLPNAKTDEQVRNLECIIGEARLLRGIVYFRLISMWGDVPYFGYVVNNDSEVSNLSRTPITDIKDSIYADFTYAYAKLPDVPPVYGRAAKPAALGFRGKLQLYWACWNNFGWPELDTFTPSKTEADAAYKASAADFKEVIENPAYKLELFRGGEPGEWGTMGQADVLPNYYYLFIPSTGNGSSENIMVFTHGGTGTGQGEWTLNDFGSRQHEFGQGFILPYFEVADRYQSTITGDFCDPLIPMNPTTNPNARTTLNSAVNTESYANRDYRMKATMMWDYERYMGMFGRVETGWVGFVSGTWNSVVIDANGEKLPTVNWGNTTGPNGYIFRKFVRNYAGQGLGEGDYAWPIMRLADVYLMYAEASNEAYGPLPDAIELVNKIRHRGNLPPLAASKTDTKEIFFDAIEQERIIELIAEGHRGFDLRRWRAIERVWGLPGSPRVPRIDTWGVEKASYFNSEPELTYQRCYIFRIPPSERERNPNLTQNTPWL